MCNNQGAKYAKTVVTVELNHDDDEVCYLRSKINIVGVPEDVAKKIIDKKLSCRSDALEK